METVKMQYSAFAVNLVSAVLIWQCGICSHLSSKLDSGKDMDLSGLSKDDLSKILDEIINRRQTHSKCVDQFEDQRGLIIRTHDSINNGAEFLTAPGSAETQKDCKVQCCKTKSKDTSRSCDLAVFQENDDDPTDSQPKCFLFSCTDENGKFVCITSPNTDYSVLRRNTAIEEGQLLDVAASNSDTTKTLPKSTMQPPVITTTTLVSMTMKATTMISTTLPTTSTSTTKLTTTAALPQTSMMCAKSCGRLDWKCDSGCCITIKQVCDDRKDCDDGSDEAICEELSSEEKHEHKVTKLAEMDETQATTVALPTTGDLSASTKEARETVLVDENGVSLDAGVVGEKTSAQRGAVLPLALGMSVTACVLLMVVCRLRIMKKKLRRRGKPLTMEESDYLINGMYL